MPRKVHGRHDLAHGDVIVVQYDTATGRTPGKRYIYLTTENLGDGPLARCKDVQTGEHTHLKLWGPDVHVHRVGHRDDGIPGFDDFELPFGAR